MQRYMDTHVSINTDIVPVHQGIGQTQELNTLLSDMPCLCHKEDSPPTIKVVTKNTHVRDSIPLKLNIVYHIGVQDSFATNVSVLIPQLETVNLNVKQTRGMLRQCVDNELGKRGNSGSRRMSSNGERIFASWQPPHPPIRIREAVSVVIGTTHCVEITRRYTLRSVTSVHSGILMPNIYSFD